MFYHGILVPEYKLQNWLMNKEFLIMPSFQIINKQTKKGFGYIYCFRRTGRKKVNSKQVTTHKLKILSNKPCPTGFEILKIRVIF